MDIHIKQISLSDLETYSSVVSTVIGEMTAYYVKEYVDEELEKYNTLHLKEKLEEEGHILLAAFDDSQIVGFYILDIDGTMLHIAWYGVIKEYRGKGIAKMFHQWVIRYCLENKMNKISCETRTNNMDSNISLMKNNFIVTALLKNFWYRHDYYMWELEITPEL